MYLAGVLLVKMRRRILALEARRQLIGTEESARAAG
jgi:hypothetical protein